MRVLIAEDNCDIREFLSRNFLNGNNSVETCFDREGTLKHLREGEFDIIVMDWMLGNDDGLQLVSEIRKKCDTPVIMLTVRSDYEDIVQAFDSGVDDFMSKPFSLTELNARVANLIRRKASLKFRETKIETNGLSLDLKKHTVSLDGVELEITKAEYQLLECLMINMNSLVPKSDIEAILAGYGERSSNFVNMHIMNLRKKIGDRFNIKTVPLKGFVFANEKMEKL